MNKRILQGKWRRLRGNLKTEWGRLTENDRRQLDGRLDQMLGLVQERYGYSRAGASKLLARYVGDYGQHRRRTALPKWWSPALTLAGIFGLTALGWFFYSRFLTETPPVRQEQVAEPDYLVSPEIELA